MERYPAKRLASISKKLEHCIGLVFSSKDFEKEKTTYIKELIANLSSLLEEFKVLKLKMSSIFIEERILPYLTRRSADELSANIFALRERFEDEIKDISFFIISPSRMPFYEAVDLVSPDFPSKFPKAYSEIKQAGKVFATTNYTAAVFHLMRAVENLLKILANSLGINLDIPNWGKILNGMKEHIASKKKDTGFDAAFYENMHAQLHVIKNAWRNPTMHVERDYDETEAKDIFHGVKGLANIIVKKLTEQLTPIQTQSLLQTETSLY